MKVGRLCRLGPNKFGFSRKSVCLVVKQLGLFVVQPVLARFQPDYTHLMLHLLIIKFQCCSRTFKCFVDVTVKICSRPLARDFIRSD